MCCVRLPREQRSSAGDLKDIAVASSKFNADGSPMMVPLQQVAQLHADPRRVAHRPQETCVARC